MKKVTEAARGLRSNPVTWLAVLLLFLTAAVPVASQPVANIINEVSRGNIDSAVQQFSAGGDNSMIPTIVTGVYGGNGANTDNLLAFAKRLPGAGLSGIALGFEALLDEMLRLGHVSGPLGTKLAAEIDALIDLCLFNNLAPHNSGRFTNLRDRIKTKRAQDKLAQEKLARETKLAQEKLAREKLEQEKLARETKLAQEKLARETKLAQEKLAQEKLDQEKLVRETKLAQEKLARETKLAQEKLAREKLAQEKLAQEINLAQANQEWSPGVLWNKACLKSQHYDEYIFVGDDSLARCSKRHNVFAWRRKGKTLATEWILEPSSNGVPNSYRIKNYHYNEYLFVEDSILCGRRRFVYTWRQRGALPGGADWVMERANGGLFKIKNAAYNEYLYASDDGHSRSHDMRSLYTWRHRTEAVPVGGLWKIEKC